MSFVFPLVYFLLSNATCVYIFKKSFGKCLPITMFFISLVYFFSQILFKTFKVGLIINILLSILIVIFLLMKKNDKKNIDNFKKNYFSSGFYSFILIYILIFIYDFKRYFTGWDEFSHWGVMIKEMFRLDKLYSNDLSTLMVHKDYPPIIPLFELFYSTISGGYAENIIYKAIHIFEFSLIIPFLEFDDNKNKKNSLIYTLLISSIIYLIILLFDGHGIINTIYVDYPMAIIVAYILASIIFEKEPLSINYLIRLSISMSFLILTKQIAFNFYLMSIFLFIFDCLIKKGLKNSFKKDKIKNWLVVLLLLIIIPLSFWKGWNMYVDSIKVDQQFKISDLKITELKGIINGTSGELWQHETAVNYIKQIKSMNLTTSNAITLSYFQCLVITLLLLYLIWIYGKTHFCKGQISLMSITLTIGYFGYAFVMLILYVFSFGPSEGTALASIERYLSTYVLICFITIIFLYSNIYSIKEDKNKYTLVLLVVILIIIQSSIMFEKIIPRIIDKKSNWVIDKKFETHSNNIKEKVKKNSKVFLIAQNTSGEYQFCVKYFLDSIKINMHNFSFPTKNENNFNYKIYYKEIIQSNIKNYDYLYIAVIDEEFIDKYSFIFNEVPKEGNVYKIIKNKGKVTFELIK